MAPTSREERYEQERQKRLKHAQGVDGHVIADFRGTASNVKDIFTEDPWVSSGTPVHEPVPNKGHCKILIFGAGFGGVLSAIKCLEAGACDISELLIVDPAGGFGGTWYYNRYPGLMCDVESYCYLPLLEEMKYMPQRRYSSGREIREYIELLALRYDLARRTMFQSRGVTMSWTGECCWSCELIKQPKGFPEEKMSFTADFVILCPGNFTWPKVPVIRGIDEFKGQMIHPARWRYDITGGDETDVSLENLADKRVAIVGTGATGIQCVPALAKHAGELFVVQRTPAAVAWRNDALTSPEDWKYRIAPKSGWQRERLSNFQAFVENHDFLPKTKLTAGDGWTEFPAISAIIGSPATVEPDNVDEYFRVLRNMDDDRSDRVRKRVTDTVRDPATAEKLKAWYPGFCKTACFHDEYLSVFNQPNVHLLDTDGKPVERLTADGIVVNGKVYPVDVIVWATGYGNAASKSLAGRANINVRGRDGVLMEDRFKEAELLTLHGVISHGFPNLFMPQSAQAGFAMSMSQRLHDQAAHIAYIITEAELRTGKNNSVVIEPTMEACEAWADKVSNAAYRTYHSLDCTPGFLNLEGDMFKLSAARRAKGARIGKYGKGYLAYLSILEDWRAQGRLEGLQVSALKGHVGKHADR